VVGVGSAAVLWWAVWLLLFRQDARRLGTGVGLLMAVFSSLSLLVHLVPGERPTGEVLRLAAGSLALVGVLALGLTVIIGAVAVSPRESGLAGRVLSGLGGLALLLAPAGVVGLAGTGSPLGVGAALVGGALATHLGLAYLVFLGAAVPYQLFPSHRASTGIIILGSTLHGGRVPPLLRRRLGRAVAERERLLARGIDPLLVPSGGKGDEENPAEGEAMAAHLIEVSGVPAERVRAETASRTTEENLILSHRLLEAVGHQGPCIISTSGYHAFRAALLARGLGFEDAAVGAPTALSYLPTATLREFVLTMWYRRRWVAAAIPVSVGLVALLVRGV
jgi:uncharacterized SAM-binding protein YcdF (DUF218 family)